MNKNFLAMLVAVTFLAGCVSQYRITLSNGTSIVTNSKPKYDKANDTYTYKGPKGEPMVIPSVRVRGIEPVSNLSKPDKFRYN